jgi:hypothetical protein
MQNMFQFYLQISQLFNVVSLCHATDVPSLSDFLPYTVNHVRIYGRNRSVIRAGSFSKLAGKGGTKPLSLTYSHTEKSSSVKSGDRSGQDIVPPRPIQATTVRLR